MLADHNARISKGRSTSMMALAAKLIRPSIGAKTDAPLIPIRRARPGFCPSQGMTTERTTNTISVPNASASPRTSETPATRREGKNISRAAGTSSVTPSEKSTFPSLEFSRDRGMRLPVSA